MIKEKYWVAFRVKGGCTTVHFEDTYDDAIKYRKSLKRGGLPFGYDISSPYIASSKEKALIKSKIYIG